MNSGQAWEFYENLVTAYGSPLYVYDLDEADVRLEELRAVLPPAASLFYSAKANPALIPHFASRGIGVEVTSIGELNVALGSELSPGTILFGGPGKTGRELAHALDCEVSAFSVESVPELELLNDMAQARAIRPTVLLRINPARAPRAKLAMAGVASQFGIDEAQLERERGRILACGSVELAGIHVYMGTQMHPIDDIAGSFQIGIDAFHRVSAVLGRRFDILNLGGGFPWPYAAQGSVDLLPMASIFAAQLRSLQDAGVQVWFESGRFLAASCGSLLSSVIELKSCRDKRFLLLDAGIHCLGGMSGLGRILRHKVDLITRHVTAKEVGPTSVVGPLCTPLDVLSAEVDLPPLGRGELVRIPNVGAYGLSASLVAFLSKEVPAEVFVRDGKVVRAVRLAYEYKEIAHE